METSVERIPIMKNYKHDISKLLGDSQRLDAVLRKAVHQALRQHKLAGNPIVVWHDGKVVWIPPEEIPIKC